MVTMRQSKRIKLAPAPTPTPAPAPAGDDAVKDQYQCDSLTNLTKCDHSYDVSDVFKTVGRGGVTRMILQGMPDQDLTSIGKFFETGSTLANATAFASVAIAKGNNTKPSSDNPGNTRKMLAADSVCPIDEMQFWNIGGTRVSSYYGMDSIKSSKAIKEAGLHIHDTAIGVLMLDRYNINERPGDPSNPLTFWPYEVIYATPQGITFAECKNVGSAGSNALKEYPLQTTAICQAFQSMAEIAASKGYKRLIITGDCGYYSLATKAYSKKLTCWGKQSWEPHPEGAFAGYCIPRFMCPSLNLEIILSMGTPQLISSNDATKNLVSKVGGASVIYLTADTVGFYSGEAKKAVNKCYEPFLARPWATDDWHFNIQQEISMLDVVVWVNDSLLESAAVERDETHIMKLAKGLVEFETGSVPFLVGLFLGYKAFEQIKDVTLEEKVWHGAKNLKPLVEEMARGKDGTPLSCRKEVLAKCEPIFDYLRPFLLVLVNESRKVHNLKALTKITDEEEFLVYAALIGNPALNDDPEPKTWEEMKLNIALRMQDTLLSLLYVGEVTDEIDGLLPLGIAYADTYAYLNVKLNQDVLSNVDRSHGIDGKTIYLFDCRYVPGFGIPVNQGLTVWTAAKNYFWIGEVLCHFAQVLQELGVGPFLAHLECTELFSFSPFLQEMGLPVVDAINLVQIASRCTDTPVRFVNFKQDPSTLQPRTPAALVGDIKKSSMYYRSISLQVRSPTEDAVYFGTDEDVNVGKLLQEQKKNWQKISFAQPLFGKCNLEWGRADSKPESKDPAPPGDSLYAASCALDREYYVKPTNGMGMAPQSKQNSYVQYAPSKYDEDWSYSAFYDDRVYTDGI